MGELQLIEAKRIDSGDTDHNRIQVHLELFTVAATTGSLAVSLTV